MSIFPQRQSSPVHSSITMTWTTAISAILLLALGTSGNPVVDHHQKELNQHYQHLSYIADYPCHHPQPRTVPVHELLSPYQIRGKAYFPEVTVLHRCDVFSGCCEGGRKCGPLHAHNVHLPFKTTFLEDMGEHHKGDWEMEYHYFDNHTICGCSHHHEVYNHHILSSHHDHIDQGVLNHRIGEDHEHEDHDHVEHSPLHKDNYKPVHEEHHDERHLIE